MQVSKQIENFLNFCQTAKTDYTYAQEQLKKCQDYTQDILHSLELDNLSYAERCKLMTKLTACRKDRRYWKDQVEELEPLFSVFNLTNENYAKKTEIERNAKVINTLKEALGQTRRVEGYHKDRKYTPKIFVRAEVTK
jgi:hypothetical protein